MALETAQRSQCGPLSWQAALRDAITDPRDLLEYLHLDPQLLAGAGRANRIFRLKVPRGFASRMRCSDPDDPLLRQVLPLDEETKAAPDFLKDPVGDNASMRAPGLLHKYHGRVLLISTGACAINCRYCFRRHFPYSQANAGRNQWQTALDAIASDRSIGEVILSGGDPLMLATAKLVRLTRPLSAIAHVKRLRIHTRMPVVLPERIDSGLLGWLKRLALEKVMVIHANHEAEFDASVDRALSDLAAAGVRLFNQSVLLAGVNDSIAALERLNERVFRAGVIPYYLHLLDKVQGAAHFQVDELRAKTIHRGLRARQSGYLVPRLVRETAGAPYKMPII